MPTTTNQTPYTRSNISGGMQRKTVKFLQKSDEVDLAINADFGRIGGVEKVKGMEQLGDSITATTTTSTSTSTSTSSSSSSSTSSSSTTTAA